MLSLLKRAYTKHVSSRAVHYSWRGELCGPSCYFPCCSGLTSVNSSGRLGAGWLKEYSVYSSQRPEQLHFVVCLPSQVCSTLLLIGLRIQNQQPRLGCNNQRFTRMTRMTYCMYVLILCLRFYAFVDDLSKCWHRK